jgi:hypothetical protein
MSLPNGPFQVVSFTSGCSQSPYLVAYKPTNQCTANTCAPWPQSPYSATYDCPQSISQELSSKFGSTSYVTFQLYNNSYSCQTQLFQLGIAISTTTTSCIDLDELQLPFANIYALPQSVKSMKVSVNQEFNQYSYWWYSDTACSVQSAYIGNFYVGSCNVNVYVQPYFANTVSSTQTTQSSASINGNIQTSSETKHMTSLLFFLSILLWAL